MTCPRCGAQNREAAQFCRECGTRLVRLCPSCGARVEPGIKFCDTCGTALSSFPAASAPSHVASPETYVPRHLVEKILGSRSALEGERKQVTVLFADLRGSMELLADRDPEEARKLLDPVVERMIEAVHRYEGLVNLVMGDGIMALFGAPLAHEDHAIRACYAALRMQQSVKDYAEAVRRAEAVPIHIRVGLNSGEVVVRSIGSDLRMDYTAIGQTTHLAARMEQMAMPGSTLITPNTLWLAEGFVEVKPLGPVHVKGLSEPLPVYELTGTGQAHSRLQAAGARGLTAFVGRQSELDALRQALEQACDGRGQVVALVGEPGVGKSRLVWEFIHSYRTHGWLILEGGSVSYGKATAYLPVLDLLRTYFHIEPRDPARSIREKVTGKVLTLDEALRPVLPALLGLLDIRVDDPEWLACDPTQRRQHTLDAAKRLLLRESQVQPLLLVFEDLHWIDVETQALLDSLVEILPTARLLLLVNYRPEYEHGWASKASYVQLRIDPLPPKTAEALLETLLGHDPAMRPLKQVLIERTEGNPFFLEETVRSLAETGILAGERGAYRLVQAPKGIQVPATVQAVLAARIDRLEPEDKRLLQCAAVIGKDVAYPLLAAIMEGPEEQLQQGLAHLQAAEFLYETSLFPDVEYTFKHALTHQVAYGTLLQERRRDLHARIVGAIESLYPDRLPEQVERLAQHALGGEIWGKAFTYLRQSAAKAAARATYVDAVRWFEETLQILPQLPHDRGTMEQAIDLRLELRQALFALGEFGRMLEHLRDAEAQAAELGDQRRLLRVSSYITQDFRAWGIASLQFLMGAHDRAVKTSERGLAIAAATGDFSRQVMANYDLGEAYHALGDYRRAMEFLQTTVGMLQGDMIRERFSRLGFAGLLSVFSRAYLVRCFAELGEFADGLACGEEAMRIAESVEEPIDRIAAYLAVGTLYCRIGDLDQALPLLERCLELDETRRHPYWFPLLAAPLGSAYALSGRMPEALRLLEQAVEQSASMRIVGAHTLPVGCLGEANVLAGRLEDAGRFAERFLELSRRYRERGYEAWALRLLGEVAAHRDPPAVAQAEAAYHQALALAGELGMRPLEAHCHFGLGRLYGRAEIEEQARDELATAQELFHAMGMKFWLARAEVALAEAE